jgi:hypothetical protein
MKALINNSHGIFCTIMAFIGIGLIVLAFFNSPVQLQVALGLAGLGFISLALVQVKRARDRKESEERYNQIMAKLEEIQQELKEREPERSGTAIADIITSSLKYYADQMTKPKKEE